MRKVIILSLLLILIIGAAIIGLFKNGFNGAAVKSLPKEVPIVEGRIVSQRTTRSDEIKRGIEVVIQSDLPFSKVVQFYRDEFEKRGIKELNSLGSSANPNMNNATAMGEVNGKQIVVNIVSKGQITEVTIQVLGNSILFLP